MSKLLTVLLFLSFLPSMGFAQGRDASLTEIIVSTSHGDLAVSFKVANCFTEDMKLAIESGIRTTFIFFVTVERSRDFWWDKTIAKLRVSHEIQYDNLRKMYRVIRAEESGQPLQLDDFAKAKEAMSQISDLKVTELRNLEKGKRYRVRMMAELDKIRLPLYLHYVFFFLSLWDFKTGWYTVDFVF